MAITQAVCNTFKRDLLKGFHDFANGGSTFKIALFTSSATLGNNKHVWLCLYSRRLNFNKSICNRQYFSINSIC
jgi:hypothetical protein